MNNILQRSRSLFRFSSSTLKRQRTIKINNSIRSKTLQLVEQQQQQLQFQQQFQHRSFFSNGFCSFMKRSDNTDNRLTSKTKKFVPEPEQYTILYNRMTELARVSSSDTHHHFIIESGVNEDEDGSCTITVGNIDQISDASVITVFSDSTIEKEISDKLSENTNRLDNLRVVICCPSHDEPIKIHEWYPTLVENCMGFQISVYELNDVDYIIDLIDDVDDISNDISNIVDESNRSRELNIIDMENSNEVDDSDDYDFDYGDCDSD